MVTGDQFAAVLLLPPPLRVGDPNQLDTVTDVDIDVLNRE